MSQTVYLVCGVSGSGKSWVCERLTHLIHYVSSDKDGKLDPTRTLELHDRCTGTSTAIKRWRSMGIEVIPVFVMGDFLQVKQQLLDRGGKITKGLWRRWKRLQAVADKYSVYTDDSAGVLRWLKKELAHRNTKHLIYKATSPSGKVYVGKTNQALDKRVYDHHFNAARKDTLFGRAIIKYGETIKWEVIEEVVGLEAANKAEIKWIAELDAMNPSNGYNLTEGGDGGKRSPESETKRIKAVTKGLRTPEARQRLSAASKNAWVHKRDVLTASIRNARSTDESRAKTKAQVERLKNDPIWLKKLSDINKQRYTDPREKEKTSASGLKAHARVFVGYKDGTLVGTWSNQKFASKDLGIPACSISRILNGHIPHAHGYTFKYLDAGTDSKSI